METANHPFILLLFITSISAALLIPGSRAQLVLPYQQSHHLSTSETDSPHLQRSRHGDGWMKEGSRRLMIGSVAPTCTYNECRGCKYKCRAEQVPVEGNDPINSPYHYRCVCHR